MALTSVLRSLAVSLPPQYAHRPSSSSSSSAPLLRRRTPLVSLWVLSLGAVSALAYRTGLAQSRSKFTNQLSARSLHSSAMGTASSTVPSIVVYVTVPNKEEGKKLAESIIKEKLAACVNRVPGIESVYWWDGKVEADSEELLIIKTRESLLESVTAHVKSNHPYDVPEVIAMPITGGNLKYLEWIKSSTREK